MSWNSVELNIRYSISFTENVKLPKGKDASDIVKIHLKWGRCQFVFSDGSVEEVELILQDGETDFKFADKLVAYASDDGIDNDTWGETDYDQIVYED